MAIRIREVEEIIIAVCANETDKKEGDVYLDDAVHEALATKFSSDWNMGYEDKNKIELMEKEKVRDAKETLEKWIKEQRLPEVLSFEKWLENNEEELRIKYAETGADRELDFDLERADEDEYKLYLKNMDLPF